MHEAWRTRRRDAAAGGPPPGRPSLLVAHPGADLYGADRMLLESVTALSGRFDVTVAVPGDGPLVAELEARGLRVARCPMPVLRNAAMRPRGLIRLIGEAARGVLPALALLRRHAGAGVYVNTVTIPSWTLLARVTGRRSLCHVHEAERSRAGILRLVLALAPVLADRVLANSRYTLDVLTEVAPGLRARSAVLYNGVHAPGGVPSPRERLDGSLRLLFIGRLSPRKGPQVALATLSELITRGVDARLDLVGSVFEGYEWFEAQLHQTAAALGLADRVRLLGFRSDVWPHLADADVVLVPSVGPESFGNTAVEAVLAARPVLVSDSSGLREAVSGYASAQALDPHRPADWADAVQRVVAGWPTFRSAAQEDARRARDRHSPERYGERLVELVSAVGAVAGRTAQRPPPSTGARAGAADPSLG